MGNIEELAASIFRFGLLHPIVVDADGNLVAGQRRLLACRALGWTEIDARSLGELTPDELRLIELEENLRRKDLTAYERSKVIVEAVEIVKDALKKQEELLPDSGKKSTGGRPLKVDSEEKVGESIGVPQQTINEAKHHVLIAEQYPFMQSWSQYKVLEAGDLMAELPDDERSVAETMFSESAMPPTDVIKMLKNDVQLLS